MSLLLSAAEPWCDLDPPEVIDHPSGYLALSPRNRFFRLPGAAGLIAFREQGIHWIALGGVHAPAEGRAELLDAFLARAGRQRRRVLAVQVRPDQVALFAARGFTVNRFGSSYGVRLAGFSLAGTRRMKARQKVKQARAAGCRVIELGRDVRRDAEVFARLRSVSGAWLRAKRKKELDFMIGELGGPDDEERRVFATLDAADRMRGFITYVPAWGQRPGYLHDLTRRLPDAPVGVMELCNAVAIERFAAEGVEYLHFGFTPFALVGDEPACAQPLLARLADWLWRYGQKVYPAQNQVAYKLKWAPEVIEPEYLACRPCSMRAVWDLLRLTRSI
jgi:lysylphosphatidylglycerol synthetase-like protein (DUF2156 family)